VTPGRRAGATVERTVSLTEETMFMRRRAAPRGAAVGSGAHAAGKKAARYPAGQAQDDAQDSDEQNERIATGEQQAQHAPPGPPAPPDPPAPVSRPVPKPTVLAELNRLSKLHREGTLTDAEFAAAKAKLLT
jgi:hypothetical protein